MVTSHSGLPLARILLARFSKNPRTLDVPLSDHPSTAPAPAPPPPPPLLSYKSPLILIVFDVEPDLSPLLTKLLLQWSLLNAVFIIIFFRVNPG